LGKIRNFLAILFLKANSYWFFLKIWPDWQIPLFGQTWFILSQDLPSFSQLGFFPFIKGWRKGRINFNQNGLQNTKPFGYFIRTPLLQATEGRKEGGIIRRDFYSSQSYFSF